MQHEAVLHSQMCCTNNEKMNVKYTLVKIQQYICLDVSGLIYFMTSTLLQHIVLPYLEEVPAPLPYPVTETACLTLKSFTVFPQGGLQPAVSSASTGKLVFYIFKHFIHLFPHPYTVTPPSTSVQAPASSKWLRRRKSFLPISGWKTLN